MLIGSYLLTKVNGKPGKVAQIRLTNPEEHESRIHFSIFRDTLE